MILRVVGIIVKPKENEDEIKSSDKFFINTEETYNIGDKILITYTGGIMESYPAQINTKDIKRID